MVNYSKKNPNIFSTNLKILFLEVVGNFLETKVGNFSGSAIRWFPREKLLLCKIIFTYTRNNNNHMADVFAKFCFQMFKIFWQK